MRRAALIIAMVGSAAAMMVPAVAGAQGWQGRPPAVRYTDPRPRPYDMPDREREPRRARCNPTFGGSILGAIAGGLAGSGGAGRRDRDFGMIGMRGPGRDC